MNSPTSAQLAERILDIVPASMRKIRAQVRVEAKLKLTMPQFRILANIYHGFNRVGKIAEYHGVSQPSMSKMVDGLVRRGLIVRAIHSGDRRCVTLTLTKKGEAIFHQVRKQVKRRLTAKIASLTDSRKRNLQRGLELLSEIL